MFISYFLIIYKQGIHTIWPWVTLNMLRYLKHHLLIITEALQKKLNDINCPNSNDVNLFVDIIFTIPVHIDIK